MKWKVCFWHGTDKGIIGLLRPLCGEYDEEKRCLWYEGSLDRFYEYYERPILIRRQLDGNVIWVTQFNSFDQR